MTQPPAQPGGRGGGSPGTGRGAELVVRRRRGGLLGRARAAGHGGRVRLRRLRGWAGTPAARRVLLRAGQALVLGAGTVGGVVVLRRWLAALRSLGAALAVAGGRVRAAAGAVGATARTVVSLRWLTWLAHAAWPVSRTGRHRRCPDCHTRIRADARVCYRCGSRDGGGEAPGVAGRLLAGGRWIGRVALLSLYRRCPDCRRRVHADARVCRSCGYRPLP